MTEIVDLSYQLNAQTQIYPGDPEFSSCPHLTLSTDGIRVQRISLGSHTGTHIDAPAHFVEDGQTVDDIPLSSLIGPAVVVDLTESGRGRDLQKREIIQVDDLLPYGTRMRRLTEAGESVILLLRTGWSKYWGTEGYVDHPFLSPDAAQWLVDIGIRVLGIDAFSPDETMLVHLEGTPETTFEVHKIILGAGAIIAENLTNLDVIQDGEWTVSLLPLKLEGSDGSPVRACAWRRG
ncbi:putative cyclase [Cytidiella melzeri]|nr:putative cyclase [Cytidiella melzeri]